MTPALERWMRVVSCLETLNTPDPADAAWFVRCHRYAIEHGVSLEEAFGLSRRGGVPLAKADALLRRNGILQEIRRRFYFDLDPRAAARSIIALAERRKRATVRADHPRDLLIEAALLTGERIPKVTQLATIVQ